MSSRSARLSDHRLELLNPLWPQESGASQLTRREPPQPSLRLRGAGILLHLRINPERQGPRETRDPCQHVSAAASGSEQPKAQGARSERPQHGVKEHRESSAELLTFYS